MLIMSDTALAIELEEVRDSQVTYLSAIADVDEKLMGNEKLFIALKESRGQCDKLDEFRRLVTNQKRLCLAMAENYDQIQDIADKLNDEIMNGARLSLGVAPFLRMNVSELYMHKNSDSLGCTDGFIESAAGIEILRPTRKLWTTSIHLSVPQGLSLGIYQWDKHCRKTTNTAVYDVCFGGIRVCAYVGRYSDDYFIGSDDD
ncbi:hypothetical protein BJ741DRAFT_629218 [Chytriomyces cf. hyalinus JEL632]|nr:hypothetical protein BJ741DRAFT_629218 [Chytriomyces cf. hyalinus JEL632]